MSQATRPFGREGEGHGVEVPDVHMEQRLGRVAGFTERCVRAVAEAVARFFGALLLFLVKNLWCPSWGPGAITFICVF